MNDQIEVLGLRCLGHHGALPGEQDQPQPFELDLVLETDFSPAHRTDALADALDYGPLIDRVRHTVETTRHHLLESLAEQIAERVLMDKKVVAVTVSLRKLRPPVAADVASVGVRVRRSRDGRSS